MKQIWLVLILVMAYGLSQPLSAQTQLPREAVAANIERVNSYYQADKEALPYDEIVSLATAIVQFRRQYPKDVIAKAYVLLAEVAGSKGDAARAFQFAVDGLTYKPLPAELQLNLEIKLAEGYFVKSKYHNVFHFVDQVWERAEKEGLVKYQLLALGYRAMANALIGEAQKAADDLHLVKELIEQHFQYAEHLQLLEVIAISYHYLGDYQTAMEIHERILKLRFALNRKNGIERTYYNLASAYRELDRLDDAFNAFWQVKQIAETRVWPIKRAYAELGIGQVLLDQQEYQEAYIALVEAEDSFKGQNLNKPYLSTLIALAKASFATGRQAFAFQLLVLAEELSEIVEVAGDQVDLYLLLANRYQIEGDKDKALVMLNRYVELQHQFFKDAKSRVIRAPSRITVEQSNKELALDLAEAYDAHTEFSAQVKQQQHYIIGLTLLSILLVVVAIVQWLAYRSRKHHDVYGQFERPTYVVPTPTQTKYIYHRAFKKARKYEYPLTIGYLTISNWPDLAFSFNKRVISEVNKTLATLINEHMGEFDQSGQINEGEYIVLFPHQSRGQAQAKFEKLIDALKVRFFANLGEFSVNIRFSLDTPAVQDIDPYIFLSRLSDVS
ncbi:tetratricopeptide repeat protein [Thalassotalea euphylliae]|nr:tetratricopeptide repeat protein [Thalassotalea euphylliae]